MLVRSSSYEKRCNFGGAEADQQLASLTFYVQTWDEYHTHTLTLGVISGPVEGILTLCVVYALTAYFGGGSVWQHSMLQSLGVTEHSFIPDFILNLAWNEWYMVYGGVVLVFNTISRYFQWIMRVDKKLTESQRKKRYESSPSSRPADACRFARSAHFCCTMDSYRCVSVSAAGHPPPSSGTFHILRRAYQCLLGRPYDYLTSHQIALSTWQRTDISFDLWGCRFLRSLATGACWCGVAKCIG